MSNISAIVLPTDFSDASVSALDWINQLSNNEKLEVHCINVVQEPMIYMPLASAAGPPGMPGVDELQSLAATSLESFTAKHGSKLKAKVLTKVLTGRPAEEICNYASEIEADMIVIATSGKSGIANLLLGSTAEGVVRQAECPVLTIRG